MCHSAVMVAAHEPRRSELAEVNAMPLYPTEDLLWDENILPITQYHGESVLALPKLNLQFLTFHDYLLRSFTLFRLESAYEVRQDVVDAVNRLQPRLVFNYDTGAKLSSTEFGGWSRKTMMVRE